MKVAISIPDVDIKPIMPIRHAMKFFAGKGPKNYLDTAMLENLARLAEHTAMEFTLGKECTVKFWRGDAAPDISIIARAGSHFENSITGIHRGLLHLMTIRRRKQILTQSSTSLPKNLFIHRDSTRNKIRSLRNGIQHLDKAVLKGEMPEGEPFFPIAVGKEVPSGINTLKTLDQLQIGAETIKFSDLACWINELKDCARQLVGAEYHLGDVEGEQPC